MARVFVFFLFFALFSLSTEFLSGRKGVIAKIVSVEGAPKLIREDGSTLKGKKGLPIFVGDQIHTGKASRLSLLFGEGTTLEIGEGGEVVMKEYLFSSKDKNLKISLKKGWINFLVDQIAKIKPNQFSVETAMATVGIRGSGGFLHRVSDYLIAATLPRHILVITPLKGESFDIEKEGHFYFIDSFGVWGALSSLPPARFDRFSFPPIISPFLINRDPVYPVQPVEKKLPLGIVMWRQRMEKGKQVNQSVPELEEEERTFVLEPEPSNALTHLKSVLATASPRASKQSVYSSPERSTMREKMKHLTCSILNNRTTDKTNEAYSKFLKK
jgi:hypothetical protein